MAYDRNSFLAGLAVGRTLWRPHKDYGTVIPYDRYILSPQDLDDLNRGRKEIGQFVAMKGQYGNIIHLYVLDNQGLCLYRDSMANAAYQFYEPIPAFANRVYIELSGIQYFAQYHQFAVCINDAQGVPGYFVSDAFAGNRLRTVYLVSYNRTTEQMNSQEDVTFEYPFTTPFECVRQTIVIDVSDIISMEFGGVGDDMPFDYDSFIQGVITGLKLGRVPKGRTPPTPSGRYILTETGVPLVGEWLSPGYVDFYNIDTWYPGTRYSDYHIDSEVVETDIDIEFTWMNFSSPTRWFFWHNTLYDTVQYVVLSESDFSRQGYIIYRNKEGTISQAVYGGFNTAINISEVYYSYSPTTYRISGANMFAGTQQELTNFLSDLKQKPMITEGG